jgi:hypothetical protein
MAHSSICTSLFAFVSVFSDVTMAHQHSRNSLHTCVPVVSADTMAQQHSQAEHGLVCVFSDSTMAHISTAAAEDSCSHRLEKKTLQGHREGDTSEGWATLFHVFLLQLHSTTLHYTRLH